jgi:hypothetical protein
LKVNKTEQQTETEPDQNLQIIEKLKSELNHVKKVVASLQADNEKISKRGSSEDQDSLLLQ